MSPEAQVRVGKAMQLAGIVGLVIMLGFVFSLGTNFVQGKDVSWAPWVSLILIYSTVLSTLGATRVQKGRQRQAEQQQAQEEIAGRAEANPAIERGPEVCRTGGMHIYLGDDATCLNGCGVVRGRARDKA